MYALATFRLSLLADIDALRAISVLMAWVALIAWIATAVGLVAALWTSYRDFGRMAARPLTS